MKEIDIDKLSLSSDISIGITEALNEDLDSKNLDICFVYKSLFKNTKYLRYIIERILLILGIEKAWVGRFVLIVDEMNNNAIEYGSSEGKKNYVRFKSSYNKKDNTININIEVEDNGTGEKHKTASEMIKIEYRKISSGFNNYESIRGRGLFLIIYKLVDNLYFKDSPGGGLIVGIKKRLNLE